MLSGKYLLSAAFIIPCLVNSSPVGESSQDQPSKRDNSKNVSFYTTNSCGGVQNQWTDNQTNDCKNPNPFGGQKSIIMGSGIEYVAVWGVGDNDCGGNKPFVVMNPNYGAGTSGCIAIPTFESFRTCDGDCKWECEGTPINYPKCGE